MAGYSTRRQRRDKAILAVPSTGDWSPAVEIDQLGASGLLSRLVIRRLGGLAASSVDVLIFYGLASDYDGVTDFTLLPDEDRAFDETGITIAGADGHTADADRNLLALFGGIVYDIRGTSGAETERMWISIKDVGGVAMSILASVEARDTL